MKKRKFTRTFLSAATLAHLFVLNSVQAGSVTIPRIASAVIKTCDEYRKIGTATLVEQISNEGIKNVSITIKIDQVGGLLPGKHAVHIHETANCNPCGAAGGHFDPGPFGESNPDANHPYHAGDLINIDVSYLGIGTMHHTTSRITLSPGPLSIFDDDGSAFIIHDFPDTYCPDGEEAGCAGGSRAACGIIIGY